MPDSDEFWDTETSSCSQMNICLHFLFSSLSIQGLGTDEDTLNEILASRTNREIREINRVYRDGKF